MENAVCLFFSLQGQSSNQSLNYLQTVCHNAMHVKQTFFEECKNLKKCKKFLSMAENPQRPLKRF
jgi:hypothetical protein